jgi:hypothetical protein
MKNAEPTEVTGKSMEIRSKFGDAIHIRPLSTLLPMVSPIHDLLITTNRLQPPSLTLFAKLTQMFAIRQIRSR